MAGFFLYVSNTTSKEAGHRCFHEIQTVNTTPSADQKINCSVHGRYVFYYNERLPGVEYPSYYSKYAFYELCELEVYGCSKEGVYGLDCNKPCPANCQERRCDVNTGHCLGCLSGYQGLTCSQVCKQGFFGDECSRRCGNCRNRQTCHHINGSCLNGCDEGVKGWNCTTECDPGFYGKHCIHNCSENCNVIGSCDRFSGACEGGCKPGWTGITCKQIPTESQTGAIVGGIFAVIGIILIAVAVVILYKRLKPRISRQRTAGNKKTDSSNKPTFSKIYQNIDKGGDAGGSGDNERRKPFTSANKENIASDEVDIDEKIHEENPYGDFYVNDETKPDFDVKNLGKIIEEKSKNEDDDFKKEYATLLYGVRYPCDVGKLPENVPKNRFKTTFPYNHSRVILEDTHSDYINANYINGFHKEGRYIASQGPKQNTMSDHWLMIWQENVAQIVMLTNLKEGLKDKCFQYWPDVHECMTCGNIDLCTIEEKNYANYVIRKIKVSNKKLNTSRTALQYQYTTWPDHGTPDPICLLLFHNHVTRTHQKGHGGPVLVHCSAGIGRTGTYIAIDSLSEALKKRKKINIAEYVKKMRENRMNMVQTYEQYKTIFLTLHEMVKAPVKVQNTSDFLSKLDNQHVKSSPIREEFQKLLNLRPCYTDTNYKMASQNGDVSSTVRPVDRYIIFLTSSVPKRGNYINAIFLPSLTSQKTFIITCHPTQGHSVDLLRLLIDHESNLVISMEPLNNIETSKQWFPDSSKPRTVQPYKTRLLTERTDDIKCSKIEIDRGASEGGWVAEIVEPLSELTKDNPQAISQIIAFVMFAKNNESDAPITVVSRDGASLCGVFCAVYNAIQQLTMDNEVDVFSVVRQLQIRRPELCSTLQEYSLIHDTLKKYVHSRDNSTGENIYFNQVTKQWMCLILDILLITVYVCALENLALRKPFWEDQEWKDPNVEWRGGNAVDGLYTNRSAAGDQCVISENGRRTATWRVDLGGVVSISHIDIYYRTGNKDPPAFTHRMAGFFLYVSNTTSKEDGHLCFHEIQTVNTTPSADQKINCPVHGRYVIYYNERLPGVDYPSYYSEFAFYELCELEVYGCRQVGVYGLDCNKPCPVNCQKRRCVINTGHCLGCLSGYQGLTCSQVCKQGFFGDECSRLCGNCRNQQTCHHINGSCLNGCDEGVKGWNCTTECDPGFYGKHCIHNCSENCNVTGSCDRFSGACKGGCKAGWTGITCKQISTASEESQVGAIVGGIFAVIVVILIAFAVVILYKRLNPRMSRQQTAGNKRTDSSNIRMKDKRITDNKIIEQQRPDQKNEDSEYYTELQVSNEACQYEVLKNCLK
nr:receptor-type tyrosine-protein phosphatase mu-like isoform X4 [Crassostrea virginica]